MPLAMTDPALLHSILFVSDQFKANIRGQKEGSFAVNHLKESIQILNERLQKPVKEISDSTIGAVVSIALMEVGSRTLHSKTALTDLW